ncbi:MAG: hypothetical protein EOP11_15265, partial [Proteobacteria bacterium]
MNFIYPSVFEAALLHQAGIPLRDTFEKIEAAYRDDAEVASLFLELKKDWDNPPAGEPLLMVGPFRRRAEHDSEYRLLVLFTELGAA